MRLSGRVNSNRSRVEGTAGSEPELTWSVDLKEVIVVVAEPTGCEAVLAHRGISAVRMAFRGRAGHASGAAALDASALHHAVRWSNRALDFVGMESHRRFGGLTGLRFNIGRLEGGIKANVIAPEAELRFGVAVNTWSVNELADAVHGAPESDVDALVAEYEDLYEVVPELRKGADRAQSACRSSVAA